MAELRIERGCYAHPDDAPTRRVFQGVRQHVAEHLAHAHRIRRHERGGAGFEVVALEAELKSRGIATRPVIIYAVAPDARQVGLLAVNPQLTGIGSRKLHQVVHRVERNRDETSKTVDRSCLRLGNRTEGSVSKKVGVPSCCTERILQIVRHAAHQCALGGHRQFSVALTGRGRSREQNCPPRRPRDRAEREQRQRNKSRRHKHAHTFQPADLNALDARALRQVVLEPLQARQRELHCLPSAPARSGCRGAAVYILLGACLNDEEILLAPPRGNRGCGLRE